MSQIEIKSFFPNLKLQRPRKLNSSGNTKCTLKSGNTLNGPTENRPSKPRELLYSRHINQVKSTI